MLTCQKKGEWGDCVWLDHRKLFIVIVYMLLTERRLRLQWQEKGMWKQTAGEKERKGTHTKSNKNKTPQCIILTQLYSLFRNDAQINLVSFPPHWNAWKTDCRKKESPREENPLATPDQEKETTLESPALHSQLTTSHFTSAGFFSTPFHNPLCLFFFLLWVGFVKGEKKREMDALGRMLDERQFQIRVERKKIMF